MITPAARFLALFFLFTLCACSATAKFRPAGKSPDFVNLAPPAESWGERDTIRINAVLGEFADLEDYEDRLTDAFIEAAAKSGKALKRLQDKSKKPHYQVDVVLVSDETKSDPAFVASPLVGVATAGGAYWLFGQNAERSAQLGIAAAILAFIGLSQTEQNFGFLVTIKQYTSDPIQAKVQGIEDVENVVRQMNTDSQAGSTMQQENVDKVTTNRYADFQDNCLLWPRSLTVKTSGNMVFTSESARIEAAAERFLKDYPKWVFPVGIF